MVTDDRKADEDTKRKKCQRKRNFKFLQRPLMKLNIDAYLVWGSEPRRRHNMKYGEIGCPICGARRKSGGRLTPHWILLHRTGRE